MVHYIGNQKPRSSELRRALLVGTFGVAAVGSFFLGMYVERNKERIAEVPIVRQIESLDTRVDPMIIYLRNNHDALDKNYSKLADIIEENLIDHPEYGNRFVQSGLESLNQNQIMIEKETYMVMFDEIKAKAEENPELMDHFGKRAQAYMEKKVLDKYLKVVEDSYKETIRTLKNTSKPVLDALKKAKDYVMNRLRGN